MGNCKILSYYLNDLLPHTIGNCVSNKIGPRPFGGTLTGKKLPHLTHGINTKQFKTCWEVYLQNGDKCIIGQFVIAQNPTVVGVTFIARVEVILQVLGSVTDYSHLPDGVLLQSADVNRPDEKCHMPHYLNLFALVSAI